MSFESICGIASAIGVLIAYLFGKSKGKTELNNEINGEMLRRIQKVKDDIKLSNDDIADKLRELKNK